MFLTIPTKIHNPSRRKRALLETAFQENTKAYDHILDCVKTNLGQIRDKFYWTDSRGKDRLTSANRAVSVIKSVCNIDNFKLGSVLKESVLKKAASNILAYLANPESNFPEPERFQERPQFYLQALEQLKISTTKEQEDTARDELAKTSKKNIAPLCFIRERDFKIYWDERKNNYYALLQLIPDKSNKTTRIRKDERLRKIRDPKVTLPNTRTAVLFPLEFGTWQEEFLKNSDLKFKTAELFKKDDEYYFNITMDVPEPKKIEPEAYLGIDLGLQDAAAWSVLDKSGRVIAQDILSGTERLQNLRKHLLMLRERQKRGKSTKGLKQQKRLDELAHLLANQLIEIALKNKCRIILEDLKDIRSRSRNLNRYLRRLVNAWNFDELKSILHYKAKLKGLPDPFFVRAHYTSLICPKCFDEDGKPFFSKENRPTSKQFKCVKCGYEADANINASENITRRAISILEKNS